jgi:DNA-directed RNA polymerase subunit RPC12/RpoP
MKTLMWVFIIGWSIKAILFLFTVEWDSVTIMIAFVVGIIGLTIYLAQLNAQQELNNYYSKPTSHEYGLKNPQNKSNYGYSCRHCGSRSIRNWGLYSVDDSKRVFICNHCGAHLYRN